MNSFLDRHLSWYPSAKDRAPSKKITVREFVGIVGKQEYGAQVERVRAAASEDDRRSAKMNLPAVQLSGEVTTGDRAQAIQQGRFSHSGILQLDVDSGGLNGMTAPEAKSILATDRHVLTSFITPSGEGAKALFRVGPCQTDEQHKRAFRTVEKYILETYGLTIDPATKDPGRLCFVPSDGAPSWNPLAVEFVIPSTETIVPKAQPSRAAPRSKAFPEPPENGIHGWLMEGAWHCRLHGTSEADTVARLESYDGSLRRPLQPTEAIDAARTVFSATMPTSMFDRPKNKAKLADYTLTDHGNAERVYASAGGYFRHVTESGQWLIWNGKRWNPDINGGIVRMFVNVMKQTGKDAFSSEASDRSKAVAKHALQSLDTNKVNSGLQMLKSIEGVTISVNDLDADQWIIGTPDGMIDLRTGQPIQPDPDRLVTKSIGASYDPHADQNSLNDLVSSM